MASRFQAATLVASPSYPNSIAWSDANLIVVASGHLVSILNPALPFRFRGLITVPKSEPYPIGVVKKEDLSSGCLLPTTLSRDPRPCVRSISWSTLGMAPNLGYELERYQPWVLDITYRLYNYLASICFKEPDIPPQNFLISKCQTMVVLMICHSISGKEQKRRRVNTSGVRRVILSELKPDEINRNLLNLGGLEEADFAEDNQLNLRMVLPSSSERELRERLVGFSFSAYKSLASNSAAGPTALNLKQKSNVTIVQQRFFLIPEFAYCKGLESNGGLGQKHKSARCVVCMQNCRGSSTFSYILNPHSKVVVAVEDRPVLSDDASSVVFPWQSWETSQGFSPHNLEFKTI
ncbi:hypothetical protein REPUB_Repub07fG0159700 [Reevesia pubescens]